MPISTVPSGRARTHSWDLVYLRSAGRLLMECPSQSDQGSARAHEWRFHDACGEELAADLHLHLPGRGRGYARERDRALERRGVGATGDLALAGGPRGHLLVGAQHAALLEQEADELARRARARERLERRAADEVALAWHEGHRPAEVRLIRLGALVHVVAVEIHAGLEAQRVARSQATGGDP